MKRLICLTVTVLFLAACSQPISHIDKFNLERTIENNMEDSTPEGWNGRLTVMTRNIYMGFNEDNVLTSPPDQIPFAVAEAFQNMIASDFPARAQALAGEIAAEEPHLIGLQEVSLIRVQSPGDFFTPGGGIPAEEVYLDYLEILLAALSQQGLSYEVAVQVHNGDVEVPMFVGIDSTTGNPLFDDVRLTDRDVILARNDVEISNPKAKNYNAFLIVPDLNIPVYRGFVAVDAEIDNQTYRFVNTHLEVAEEDSQVLPIQLAQATELITELQTETLPIVLAGDLNSRAPNGSSYNSFIQAGYVDIWEMPHNKWKIDPGYTFGHDDDLLNEEVNFDRRIDFILIRSSRKTPADANGSSYLNQIFVEVTGDETEDRTTGGLWPSDHGGVVARLRIKP